MKPALLKLYRDGYHQVIAQLQADHIDQPGEALVRDLAHRWIKGQNLLLPLTDKTKLIDSIAYSIIGLGPLEFLLRDDSVSEIMVNGADSIFIEQNTLSS